MSKYGLLLTILLVASTIQYGSYTGTRFLVPLLGVLVVVWSLFASRIDTSNKLSLRTDFNLHAFLFFSLVVCSFIGNSSASEALFDTVKIFLPVLMSLLAIYLIYHSRKNEIHNAILLMSVFALVFLGLEFALRSLSIISNPSQVLQNFYALKMDSPFMVDSNAVGLYALFYFVIHKIYFAYFSVSQRFRKVISAIFLVFIFLTLSRAAIATTFVLYLYLFFFRRSMVNQVQLVILGLVAVCFLSPFIYQVLTSDGSGSTKLGVLQSLPTLSAQYSIKELLFGFGINEGNYAYSYEEGKYSHLLITMLIGHFGLIGFACYFLFFLLYGMGLKSKGMCIFLVANVVGLSYLHPFLETIFLCNGIAIGLSYKYSSSIRTEK
ncbi:hypothetical protein [Pseudoalteromonas ardens]|uniref:O-antigen ligase domain-containing protein n=1 Tax=Pseudoalteromonas rubra TaxID=43658 RepID=A0A0L0ETL1_9GAMM|nr:hypothetical protein [Pseudoalteromonas sp. R96]KNC67741.1 hypothetical protein AC626_08865 [Pseudoalteromonas rubra]MDK1312550.1 hypothetical protein [Pseudoalteromonas sp. R96]